MRPTTPGARTWLIGLILVFALANGVLYALMLPLWEGFDEAFHYGYVQELSAGHWIPSLRDASLSREVWDSLRLAPVSHVVRRNLPELMTFGDYFRLSNGARVDLRTRLEHLAPGEKYDFREFHHNYEAQQAPAAYLVLALADKSFSSQSLLVRARILRIVSAVLSILLTAGAVVALCRQLEIASPFLEFVLFLTFCSQMFYATVAHISNDWLAVPLASWWIVAAIVSYRKPDLRNAAISAVLLACGLLTKAYFLAFVPLFLGIIAVAVLVRKRMAPRMAACGIVMLALMAGPWYVRNLKVNRAFTGMQEEAGGIGLTNLARSATAVPWFPSIGYMARASLWTGNNQFNTFSRPTLNALLFLLTMGGGYYLAGLRARGLLAGEWVILAAIGLFVCGLAYDTVVTYVATNGASAGASPWYMQVLLVPVLSLVARGLARAGRLARVVALLHVMFWTYLILATYVLKLVPQYGGYDLTRVHVGDLVNWYLHGSAERDQILSTLSLGPPHLIYGLVSMVSICGVLMTVLIGRLLLRQREMVGSKNLAAS